MRNHAEERRISWRNLVTTAAIAALAITVFLGLMTAPRLVAQAPIVQSPVPQWEADAGGKIEFDLASVKQNNSDADPYSNVPLGSGDLYTPTGGLFSATNWPLSRYIDFSYKVNAEQVESIRAQIAKLPKWANSNYDIQARAAGNPTKDQIRLMLRALLEDRFKLVIHRETRQFSAYALVLTNLGKTGPQLQLHPPDAPCSNDPAAARAGSVPVPSSPVAGGFPTACGGIAGMEPSAPGRERIGARNVSMTLIAGVTTLFGNLGRPVIDGTGLAGNVDFWIEWVPEPNGPFSPGADFQGDPNGPSLTQALREQLGLKLVQQTAPVDLIVIDHIEEPSPN